MTFNVQVKIKWRAWGITFGSWDETVHWKPPFSIPIPIPPFKDTLYNNHGVFVQISH